MYWVSIEMVDAMLRSAPLHTSPIHSIHSTIPLPTLTALSLFRVFFMLRFKTILRIRSNTLWLTKDTHTWPSIATSRFPVAEHTHAHTYTYTHTETRSHTNDSNSRFHKVNEPQKGRKESKRYRKWNWKRFYHSFLLGCAVIWYQDREYRKIEREWRKDDAIWFGL